MKKTWNFVPENKAVIPDLKPRPVPASVLDALTYRERQVMAYAARGIKQYAIAVELGVSIKTINKHIHQIHIKLGVHDPVTLAHLALACGLIENLFILQEKGNL